jgi:GTP-binding protein
LSVYSQAKFELAAEKFTQLPADVGIEVAFGGRSNAGKSSALNALTGRNALARTSKTPGRTQQIISFKLDERRRLIDLPGYGFAKVPLAQKTRWQHLMEDYFNQRQSLRGLILLVDVRHPLKDFDWQMIDWCAANQLAVHVLLTKADKLSRNAANQQLFKVKPEIARRHQFATVQLFSALKKTGVEEARACLDQWFEFSE